MSTDRIFDDEPDLSHRTPDDDAPPRAQDRRSIQESAEPENFDNVPDHDDSPETMAQLEEFEKATRRARIPPVRWADDKDQPDFAHTLGAEEDGLVPDPTFKLTPEVFELLIAANSFKPDGPDGKFVFGLRGGRLANGKREVENADSVEIEDTRPNHVNFRCTIGFYDRANKKITAYLASTVPNTKYMTNYFRKKNNIRPYGKTNSNLLPTGCYVFRKNAHGGGRIKPAMRMTDPDNLTNDAVATVLRTSNDLSYKHKDVWDQTMPYDNIHCAYWTNKFSSAGCQTICGANKSGPWGKFQRELDRHAWNTRFDYLLLTGREAALAAKILETDRDDKQALIDKHLRRLRLGSHGPAVAALQRKMGYSGKTQYFGPSTRSKMVELETNKGLATDSIFSTADETAFGWTIFNATDPATGEPAPAPTPPAGPGTAPAPAQPPGLVPESLIIVGGALGSQPSPDMKTLVVPGEGTWSVGPVPGKITFTPEPGFHGTPHPITYQIQNTAGAVATAQVSVTVLNVNKAPVVEDDAVRTVDGQPVTIAVLQNDADSDGTLVPATVRIVSASPGAQITADGKSLTVPDKGTWHVDPATGVVQFSPVAGFTGTAQATYEVADEDGATATGGITVTVMPAAKPPVSADDTAQTPEGTPVTIDVLANDASGISPAQPQPQPPAQPKPEAPGPIPAPPAGPGPTAPTPTPGGELPMTGAVQLSAEQLRRFAPKAKEKYINALLSHGNEILTPYGINANPMRLCHFLAQIGHESGGFTIDRESLYYTSAKRIRQVWPSRFKTLNYAAQFVKNEKKLAAKVYDGRVKDLGNTQPGDGYKYRGRGLIQITGRGGYRVIGKRIGVDLENDPDLATDGVIALKIAAQTWYDRTRSGRTMNQLADDNKIDIITLRINGGYTNLAHRKKEFERAWEIWGTGAPPQAVKNPDVIERGDRGERVKTIQRLLIQKGYFPADETVDGVFGGNTQKAVMRFQYKTNINVNGIVDKQTLQALQAAPDAERRTRHRPRSARDPRTLEQHSRRRTHPFEDESGERWRGYVMLAAILLAVLAIAIPCIMVMSELASTPARRGPADLQQVGLQMINYFWGSGAMLAASLALAGISAVRTASTGSSQVAPPQGVRPAELDDVASAETETTDEYWEEQGEDVVLGADVPLNEIDPSFDDAFFEDPEPVRYAPGLPEDVATVPEIATDPEPLPELSPEDGLGVPGAPVKRDGITTSATPTALPFNVTDPDVPLVLIKMFGGDNNLSGFVDRDLDEIAAGIRAANGISAMIGLADFANAPSSIIEITRHGIKRDLGTLGEIDTGDPRTLAQFVARAIASYPNARKAIGFWDHGTGVFDEFDEDEVIMKRNLRARAGRRARPARRLLISSAQREAYLNNSEKRGMLHDSTGGVLTNLEAGRMLEAAFRRADHSNRPIDLIYSDTCLNGMVEVLEELGPFAECIVASSDTEPGAGWDYEQWIHETGHTFPQSAHEWGQRAVRAFGTRYRDLTHEHPCTLGAFRTENDIAEAFAQVVAAAEEAGLAGWFTLNHIRSQTQAYDNRDAYDILDFASRLQHATSNGNQPAIAQAAQALDHACRAARIDFVAHGRRVQRSQGLAFWFPSNSTSLENDIRTYRNLKFAQTTGWADYLEQQYLGAVS